MTDPADGCPECWRTFVVKKVYGHQSAIYWCDCGWWEPVPEDEVNDATN